MTRKTMRELLGKPIKVPIRNPVKMPGITVPAADILGLKKLADREGGPLSEMVRRAIKVFLAAEKID